MRIAHFFRQTSQKTLVPLRNRPIVPMRDRLQRRGFRRAVLTFEARNQRHDDVHAKGFFLSATETSFRDENRDFSSR